MRQWWWLWPLWTIYYCHLSSKWSRWLLAPKSTDQKIEIESRVTDDLKRQITLTKAWWSLFLGWIFLCVSESSDRYIRVAAAWNLGHLLKLSNYKSQAWPVYFSMHENCHINIRKKVRVTWNVEQVQSTFKCPFCCNQRKKDEHHSVCVVTRQGDP